VIRALAIIAAAALVGVLLAVGNALVSFERQRTACEAKHGVPCRIGAYPIIYDERTDE
jgi:hypothetical protein